MLIFKQAKPLQDYLEKQQQDGKKIGFVPTMGALHEGHGSLVTASLSANDLTVCSIFVNPTQFNNAEDFEKYPITIEKDVRFLAEAGCSILFLPSVKEIYPADFETRHFDLGPIEHRLEGHFRPGHFQGVCQVVDRLLDIVHPDKLYLGQKDFQQCMVIARLLKITGRNTELVICPTIRETSGLAMSSRNLRLDAVQREAAQALYRELQMIRQQIPRQHPADLKRAAKEHLEQNGFTVDYFEIARSEDLSPAQSASEAEVALVAASIGSIRLIDNLTLN